MFSRRSAIPSSLRQNAVAEAMPSVPERSNRSMPSWITSVYAVSGRNGPSSRPASTALAMLPDAGLQRKQRRGQAAPSDLVLEEVQDVTGDLPRVARPGP